MIAVCLGIILFALGILIKFGLEITQQRELKIKPDHSLILPYVIAKNGLGEYIVTKDNQIVSIQKAEWDGFYYVESEFKTIELAYDAAERQLKADDRKAKLVETRMKRNEIHPL